MSQVTTAANCIVSKLQLPDIGTFDFSVPVHKWAFSPCKRFCACLLDRGELFTFIVEDYDNRYLKQLSLINTNLLSAQGICLGEHARFMLIIGSNGYPHTFKRQEHEWQKERMTLSCEKIVIPAEGLPIESQLEPPTFYIGNTVIKREWRCSGNEWVKAK